MPLKTSIMERLSRRKHFTDDIMKTPLKRCLTTVDLTLLGIGHMVSAGIFVLTGTVVKTIAGPSTIISYIPGGIAATLSSLCYAEFGARVPKAGSSYTYTYVTIGELWAFIIGWNLILEHMLGVASDARAWSGSFDALFSGAIRNGTLTHVGEITVPWLSEYPDFIALLIVGLITVFIAIGAKVTANLNSVFTGINLFVVVLMIVVGFCFADTSNWTSSENGGFFPNGAPGVFSGAAICFYAYTGIEGIAVAGEEAKNPAKSIPRATGIAIGVVAILYIASAASLTLMVPSQDVDINAPFSVAFEELGLHWMQYFVAFGALFGITSSMIGGLFLLPRAAYAMASDGLLFSFFSKVHPRTQTPIISIIIFGLLSGLMAFLVDLETLVEFMSIGTLLGFTFVSACILILRYRPADELQFELTPDLHEDEPGDEDEILSSEETEKLIGNSQNHHEIGKLRPRFAHIPILKDLSPGSATVEAVVLMTVFTAAFWAVLLFGFDYVEIAAWWSIILLIIFALGFIACLLTLLAHQQNESFRTFQVPFVPFLPALSIVINIGLMLKLQYLTWIRLSVWQVFGFIMYFAYGIRHSVENRNAELKYGDMVVKYRGIPDESTEIQPMAKIEQLTDDLKVPNEPNPILEDDD